MKNKILVSVIINYKDEELFLRSALESIFNQSYTNFELILVDDGSTDESNSIVSSFDDSRLKLFQNKCSLGIAKSRNIGLFKSKGDFIFFTDADCVVDKDWIHEGLKHFDKGYEGVEGKIIYMNDKPTLSDKIVQNLEAGSWMTANMAYRATTIKKLGGFNESFGNMMEDRELALRVLGSGKIFFSENMIVHHQIKKWNLKSLINRHKDQAVSKLLLYDLYGDKTDFYFFVLFPGHLATILFPPLLLIKGFRDGVKNMLDLKLLFSFYFAYLLERIYIIKMAIKKRRFII